LLLLTSKQPVRLANELFFYFSLSYVFLIGKSNKPWVSLPADKGIRKTITEEREKRLAQKAQ
jgi:small subunit ribosomal protein S4e